MSDRCKHGVLFPHECSECQNEVTNEDVLRERIAELERELTEQARCNGMGSEREAALLAKVERLEREVEGLKTHNAREWFDLEASLNAERAAIEKLAAAQATIQQMRDDFLTLARMAEDLKRDCGMDPESPQAIRNAQYMNLSYLARRNLALPADRTALDAMLKGARKDGVLTGIAAKGEGREPSEDETVEQFVLGYVKRLEAELAAIKGQEPVGEVEFPDPADERDGIWVSWKDRRSLVPGTKLYAMPVAPADKDAERYRWLRDPTIDVGLVIDKKIGEQHYEYRAGEELDAAIDAAMAKGE